MSLILGAGRSGLGRAGRRESEPEYIYVYVLTNNST